MKLIVSIQKIKFASINHKYKIGKNKKFILADEYRTFKELIFSNARRGYIEPPYSIMIGVEMYQDYDNILKPITDALKLAKIIKDDRYIYEAKIFKTPIKRGQLGCLDVWIETIDNELIK